MAKSRKENYDESFAFYEQLKYYYLSNKGKIRSRYNDLTKKFLSYNDKSENKDAYLRTPQFEALEMYVFIKEFMNNAQVYEIFDDWRNRRDRFADASYYSIHKGGQGLLFDEPTREFMEITFSRMQKYIENYPNYIFALTMGLGKTVLMATCIFYEFLLANKYPKDRRFCKNALVFAPDKTVLTSLREIIELDKSKVVPPEYARLLDTNIKFHFLEESGVSLNTIDDSNFNIIISNTQKIIVKKRKKDQNASQKLFAQKELFGSIFGEDESDEAWDDDLLIGNQRFSKLCRLPQLGIYVDEAHHLFGADLEKQIRKDSATKTSLRDTINMLANKTSIVACYNYTGTPYVDRQVLPEVVYAYGLRESIQNGYLKEANLIAYDNVKSEEFLSSCVDEFIKEYGGKTYEGLKPKLAIYASRIDEAVKEIRPLLEKILAKHKIDANAILLNVGDDKYTKNDDIRNFNNLDVVGSVGNDKQFIILVDKGKEGWNCRSLFGVAMYRSPKSKVFVLQATMRCLRSITDERQTATVFLSKENYDTLSNELNKNFNMDINDMKAGNSTPKSLYKIKVLPPPRTIKLKKIWHEYELREKEYKEPIDFGLSNIDFTKYSSTMLVKDGIAIDTTAKKKNIDYLKEEMKFSVYSLTGEVARYLNISCLLVDKILRDSLDGTDEIVKVVSKYNKILYDVIVPKIFDALYEIKVIQKEEDRELVLLREPKVGEYYEFWAKDDLVVSNTYGGLTKDEIKKSFHADTYCFDSNPEKQCFLQYIRNKKVKEIYFTGMFTANQGDFLVQYYDPESGRIRSYYPDFLAKLEDDSYQIIEVKADNKIDDELVKAKELAAREIAVASGVEYKMFKGSDVMNIHIL